MYPGIALAHALAELPAAPDVLFVGTTEGVESRLVPEAGLRFTGIEARGLERSLGALKAVLPLARGFARALRILAAERPAVVVGMGGFVSAPVVAAALARRIPVVLHEQNSVPGLANRAFAGRARAVCLTFAESAGRLGRRARTVLTGNPVRPEIADLPSREEACERLGLDDARPVLLVLGGSRGARRINKALVEAYGMWPDAWSRLQILHIAGSIEFDETIAALEARSGVLAQPDHRVVPYIEKMGAAFAAASLMVSRAGATTVAESTVAGVAAVLVPYPYATEDHQRRNAEALVACGGAVSVADDELDGQAVVTAVTGILADEDRLGRMRAAALAWGRPDAARALAREVMKAGAGRDAEAASSAGGARDRITG